jgi:protein O-mannosyl-transferase
MKKGHQRQNARMKNLQKTEETRDIEKSIYYLALAVILVLTIIIYLPVFHNRLLDWDDSAYIKNNPLIYSINLKEIFSHTIESNYHPVTILVLALEYHFFGLNATAYHAFNLLIHLLNVILVFYSIFLLSNKARVALVVALLFGIHPLHVESVAWAAELKDLLYTFFFLLSYIFYLKYLKTTQKKSYFFSLVLFLVSLLAKAMAASLPVVLILTDYFKDRKITVKTITEKLPFLLLAFIFGIVAVYAQKSTGAISDVTVFHFHQRVVFACFGFITYIFKLLLPFNLSSFYPYPIDPGANIPIIYYAYVLCFIGVATYVIYSLRFTKNIIFGMGFFTVTVFLVLQLLPVGSAVMADRYSYIPSIGIFYLAGEGVNFLWNKKIKTAPVIILSVFTVLFSLQAHARCGVWENDMTLWNDVINKYKTVPIAYNNRGLIFKDRNRNEEALKDFNKAIELNPAYASAYNNRGNIYISKNRYDEALKDYNKAIGLKPDYADAYNDRGNLFMNENKYKEAINDYIKAIELKPDFAFTYNNRGLAFMSENKNDEALKDFDKAIQLKTDYAEAYYNRGNLFMNKNMTSNAMRDYQKAIEIKPDYAEAYNNLGNLSYIEKRNEEAINYFTKSISLKPQYAQAYYNRAVVEYFLNKKEEACTDLKLAAKMGYQPAIQIMPQICK